MVCGGVHAGVQRGVQRCTEMGSAQRGTQMCGGAWRGVQRYVEGCTEVHGRDYHWLPLATIDLVSDNRELVSLKHILTCYTYYRWLSLSTLKVHHCLSLVTIGCP